MNTTGIGMEIMSSCRALWRQRKATSVPVLCMALGMSTSIAVFTLVRSELLRPLPYQRPEQLLAISAISARHPAGIVLTPEFAAWRDESHTLAQVGAWND